MDQSKKSGFTDKLGDAVEKVGTKISDLGAPSLGKKIHDAGDRIEKSHSNPQHPVDESVAQKPVRSDRDM